MSLRLKGILQGIDHPVLGQLIENLDDIPELANLIQSAISPDAPNVITEGNIIQTGFDETLDRSIEWLKRHEKRAIT